MFHLMLVNSCRMEIILFKLRLVIFSRFVKITCLTYFYSMQMIKCPIGTYSLGGFVTNCTKCPAGYSCPEPTSTPSKCTGGKFISIKDYSYFKVSYLLAISLRTPHIDICHVSLLPYCFFQSQQGKKMHSILFLPLCFVIAGCT